MLMHYISYVGNEAMRVSLMSVLGNVRWTTCASEEIT